MASERAVKLNEQIARVAQLLPAGDHEFGFSCECGCDELVRPSLASYENQGAWIDSHRPNEACGRGFSPSAMGGP